MPSVVRTKRSKPRPRTGAQEAVPLAARTEPAPDPDPFAFLEAHRGEPRFLYWRNGRGVAAAGVAAHVGATGPRRFDEVRASADRVMGLLIHERGAGVPAAAGPVWIGGAAFSSFGGDDEWPAASFVLAARQLRIAEAGAFLTTVDGPKEKKTGAWDREEAATGRGSGWNERPAYPQWESMVRTALGIVATRRLEKAVLSRTIERDLRKPLPFVPLLRSLAQAAPEAHLFFQELRPGHAFLCASPELLVARRGDRLETQALAGSRPRGHTPAQDDALARQLAESPKDAREHEIVVKFVQNALSQLGYMWETVHRQRVLKLPNVQHLETRFRAEGASKDHVLHLVDALHPTPAVAGWPREEALALLAKVEATPRGWYAGPVGWFDRAGEGEFAAALRTAHVEGLRVRLHAGCGVVRGSLPMPEWKEGDAKLRLLRALIDAAAGPGS